jgi:hypothetical protein
VEQAWNAILQYRRCTIRLPQDYDKITAPQAQSTNNAGMLPLEGDIPALLIIAAV